ncbi:hypothetical protein [Phycicoccus avicenniae]|uniref:hypothetical protein n=1 Tax=Phycicoccus avicenniae TaxID=2828860 RepID=UPI003D27F018
MTFEVQPQALRQFAGKLDGLEADAGSAHTYASHTKPPASGFSAMVRFLNSCQEVEPTVKDFFTHLKTLSGGCGDEMVKTAREYERLDEAARARLDADYPS